MTVIYTRSYDVVSLRSSTSIKNKNSLSISPPLKNKPLQPPTLNAKSNNPVLSTHQLNEVSDKQWQIYQNKRHSSPGHSLKTKEPKFTNETKSSFTSPNRFESLNYIETENSNEMIHESSNAVPPPPPSILISFPMDFNEFAKSIVSLVGKNGLEFKSLSKHLKLTLITISSYRHLLNKSKIEYFTYQVKEDKPYRVSRRNVHPTTDINFIKEELSQNGFSVRNITNIQSKFTKTALPIFFVDLEPDPNNANIFKFNLSSLCYTKIKIEEPHSRRDLP